MIITIYLVSLVLCFILFKKLNEKEISRRDKIGIILGLSVSLCPVLNLIPIVIYFAECGTTPLFFKSLDKWFRGE